MSDAEAPTKRPVRSISPEALKDAQREEFATRLYRLMVKKGWSNAELARKAKLERNTITTYFKRRSLPSPSNMQALADALGVTVPDLLPDYDDLAIKTAPAVPSDNPTLRWRMSDHNPAVGFLEVNRWVSTSTGLKIQELLSQDRTKGEDEAPD